VFSNRPPVARYYVALEKTTYYDGGMSSRAADVPIEGIAIAPHESSKPRPCSTAEALKVIGERWTLLAIREMAYGIHRFDQIAAFTGASRDILTERLRKLEREGIVERRQYSQHPPRFEYHLTPAGDELRPILRSIGQWGERWIAEQPDVAFRHDCGHRLQIDHVCHHCGRRLTPGSVDRLQVRSPRS
jgi:DNA-binding HxlR family transcriptional regulator